MNDGEERNQASNERENRERDFKDLINAPGYEENEDDSTATGISIDFTNPIYEQLRGEYSYWKDGQTIAKDLASYITMNYPVIAEKWGYERLVNEIDLHYKLFRLGYKTERTKKCDISIENDSSWDLIDAYTRFSTALGKNFKLPL